MHISVLCQGGGHTRCGDFCQIPLPRDDMSKCNTLTAFYPILPFVSKATPLGQRAVFKKIPTIMTQLGGSEREGRELELDLHVPSYQKIKHGLPCNKVFYLFRFCSVLFRKGVLPLFEILKNST